MKNKTILFIVLILSALLISSCTISNNSTIDTTKTLTTETVITTEDKEPLDIIYNDDYPPIDELNCVEDEEIPKFKNKKCSFTLAVLPDTQLYTENERIAQIYYSQTKWIASNYNRYNIKFTAHLGDIVNTAYNVNQWKIADKAHKILDNAEVPYGVTAGNHDFRGLSRDTSFYLWPDNKRSTSEFYLKYFSKERTSKIKENYGGHSDNGWNSYYYFEGYGRKYMVLFVDYAPSEETIEWANKVLDENKNIPTILITHILVNPVNTGTGAALTCEECIYFWNKIVYENDQIFMTINGHYIGQGYLIKKNKYGNDVLMIVVDYQGDYNGGNGMMRLIEFDEPNNKIYNISFSPYVLEKPLTERNLVYDREELTDSRNKFEINWNFQERFNFTN